MAVMESQGEGMISFESLFKSVFPDIPERIEEQANRIAELQRSNAAVLAENQDLAQQLKVMTEDRDEYRRRTLSLQSSVSIEVADIRHALEHASKDELCIAREFVEKLMGEGRKEHGALDLSKDERSLLGEAKDELTDTISYLLMERRRIEVLSRLRDEAYLKVDDDR